MNKNFLAPVPVPTPENALNQPSSDYTRRQFIKRSGAATVAVFVAAAAMQPMTAEGAVDASLMDGPRPSEVSAVSGCWHDWDARPANPGGPPPNPGYKCSKCLATANPPLPWFSITF